MKEKFITFTTKVFKIELVSGSIYTVIIGLLGSVLAYLFNVILARKLSPADYGIFVALITFMSQVTVLSQFINIPLAQYATQFFSKKQTARAAFLYKKSVIYMLLLCGAIIIIFLLCSHIVGNFLQIKNILYIWMLGLLVALTYFSVINSAFLQSMLRFRFMAVLNFTANASKLILGAMFVFIGFKVYGALGAVFFASLIPVIIGFYQLRFLLQYTGEHTALSKKDIFSYAIATSLISYALTSFSSTDLLLVKHFFSPTTAGLYSGLSLIGRVIFYLTAPIGTVLFPLVIKKFHQGEDFLKTFYLALGLVFVPSILITLFYFIFPDFTVKIFFQNKQYAMLHSYVGWYGLFMTIISLLSISTTFLLSLKKTFILLPMLIGALLQVILIFIFHNNFLQIISISTAITSILLIGILLYYGKNYGSKKEQKTLPLINNTSL